MLRQILVLSILSIVTLSTGTTPEYDAINIIVQNREYILNKLESNKPIETGKLWGGANKISWDTMALYIKNIQSIRTDKEILNFIREYIRYISFMSHTLGNSEFLNDTINTRFLANLLRSKESDINSTALERLVQYSTFESLKLNSAYIKKNLEKSSLEENRKIRLLGLLGSDEKEKNAIINSSVYFAEKASVDDTSLDSLISMYKKEKTSKKNIFAKQLMGTGQKRAVKAALEDFCAPVYDIRKFKVGLPCTSSVYQRTILYALQRYYPNEPLFDQELNNLIYDYRNTPDNLEKTKVFWNNFIKWVLVNYNLKLQDTIPYSTFLRGCGP